MTNKILQRTEEQFMSDYVPVYQPIYPLFLTKSQQYQAEVGKMDFRRVETVGDIRTKHITPKDTEIRQIAVMEGKKTFKKYFLANQFVSSTIQDQDGADEINARVMDELQVQTDELLLTGEGTSPSDVLNNGLYHSNDSNYVLEGSTTVPFANQLHAFHTAVVTTATKANQIAGRKLLVLYGTQVKALFNSLFPNSDTPVKEVLAKVLGSNYSIVELPDAPTPSGANGWIVANLDQIKLHYTALPQLKKQGVNEEKMYYWSNFFMGSMMLEVLANGGIIRQPATIALS